MVKKSWLIGNEMQESSLAHPLRIPVNLSFFSLQPNPLAKPLSP
jgi:hypothetical protein